MANQPDLRISSAAPVERFRESSETFPAALYKMIDVSQDSSKNAKPKLVPPTQAKLSPLRPARAKGRSGSRSKMRWSTIFSSWSEGGGFDPLVFIVLVEKDWQQRGVLLVCLDADPDGEECKTDKIRVKAEGSGGAVVGVQLGNSDWEESKESYVVEGSGQNWTLWRTLCIARLAGREGTAHCNVMGETEGVTQPRWNVVARVENNGMTRCGNCRDRSSRTGVGVRI